MIMKVSTTTPVPGLAGAIAHRLREVRDGLLKDGDDGTTALQAIGAAATNQIIKAAAAARDFLADDGIDFALAPHWVTEEGRPEGETVSAMRFEVVVTGDGGNGNVTP